MPASVDVTNTHECAPETLAQIVYDMNCNELNLKERLSNQIYHYNRQTQILHEEFGMTQEEFHDNGIDSLDYLFEAQKVDETVGKIGVFHLHQDEDDYHFANEYNNTFYRAVKLYQRFKEQEENHLTIDTVALMYFGAQQSIDPLTFDVLVNAIEHDDRVNVIVEIDLDEGMMSVKDKSGVWKTYRLDDILYAVDIVDRNAGKTVNSFSERIGFLCRFVQKVDKTLDDGR